jgi:hypothetical protein
MNQHVTSAFALPERLGAKADPALVARDEQQFAAIAASLAQQAEEIVDRLATLRTAPGGRGRGAMDRDIEIHHLTNRLKVLRRYGLDVCLGRMVAIDGSDPVYVGRLALTDSAGDPLLLDWRAPASEPFFAATSAHPMGLTSRRRYRWSRGRVTDYWDEVFGTDGVAQTVPDDDSAFTASLGSSRSARMQDVLSTIAAEQDAVIRAGSQGALVVDGGPGTGKTVVALHRTAYLLYADPRLGHHHGGVLFVGPHVPYLAYVADVLPSLGEEGVQTVTLRDLVVEGASAGEESDLEVARLKATDELVRAIEPAVAFYEEPPSEGMTVETEWADVWLSATEWVDAFDAPDPGTPHNEARDQVWEELLDLLVAKVDGGDVPPELLRRALAQNDELTGTFGRAWPILDPAELVGDLWSVPAYLRRCAPGLSTDQVRALQRSEPAAWTMADLPLLDAARHRIGDPDASVRQRRRSAATAVERARMDDVVDYLLQNDDDPESPLNLLRRESLREDLVDEAALPTRDPDLLAGPFSHIVVDEAQELTDAQWQMLVRRCPSRSFTIAGDRAQARHGFSESWQERLQRVGFDRVAVATLSINYRTPVEVMAEAEPVIRELLPDANVPTSIRSTGLPVRRGPTPELRAIVDDWLATHDGVACVIGDPSYVPPPRVQSLDPEHCKGLEFDLVVLVDPERFGDGIEGTVDRYVSMTRATQELVILSAG